jgi:hypothetical protein
MGDVMMWRPIDSAPSDEVVLLYTPHTHETNPERIEARVYRDTRGGSCHAWATHWQPLPKPPGALEDAVMGSMRSQEPAGKPSDGESEKPTHSSDVKVVHVPLPDLPPMTALGWYYGYTADQMVAYALQYVLAHKATARRIFEGRD